MVEKLATYTKLFIFTISLVLLCGFLTLNGSASVQEASGFSVQTELPDNQRASGKSYFDLRMTPNQKQDIFLVVRNISDKPIVLNVSVQNAYTNTAGNVDYNLKGIKDDSGKYFIEDIATLHQTRLELASGEKTRLGITLNMPSEEFDGELVGGIFLARESSDEDNTNENITLVNSYSQIIGLVLNETDKEVDPDFQLLNVEPALVNGRTGIIHSIRNSKAVLADNIDLTIEILSNDKIIWALSQENVKMAPTSMMDYIFYLNDVTISPGKYLSKVTMTWEDAKWEFEREFIIQSEKANDINDNSAKFLPEDNSSWNIKAVTTVFIIIAFIFLILFLLTVSSKDKSNKDDDKTSIDDNIDKLTPVSKFKNKAKANDTAKNKETDTNTKLKK